jgi:hypothetical protein
MGGKYFVQAKSGTNCGGPYDTKQEADARIEQIKKHQIAARKAKELKSKYKK